MHPTTPFNTRSWTVIATEAVGWLAVVTLFYGQRWEGLSTFAQCALVVAWGGYAVMRFCSLIHWHRDAQRGEGLEQQFIQVGVAAVYGFCIATVAAVSHVASVLIYPVAFVLAGVAAINLTLLYLYHTDKSTVPINFYSHRKHLQEDA